MGDDCDVYSYGNSRRPVPSRRPFASGLRSVQAHEDTDLVRMCSSCGESNLDRARFCLACGSPLQDGVPDRRPVTALFCDLVASTELAERLDAEVLHRVLDRYHELMRKGIERHGGVVEKFIGDAVVGIFGVPEVHEDDALRAVRAALEMCDSLPALCDELDLDLRIRIGIQTGEAVTDIASAIRGGTGGDTFNTAARLQTLAPTGGVVVGDATGDLVGRVVELEPLEPLSLKGKKEPMAAWVVMGLSTQLRTADAPIVGRRRELALLDAAFEEANSARAPVLVTLLAPPGVGKSRLGEEIKELLAERATVLVAQTPSYGDGITFAPLVDLLADAAGTSIDDAALIIARLREKLATEPDGVAVGDRLAHVLGVEGTASGDTGWALGRLLESFARERPIVAILDDVHWAEPPMLDLVEAVTERTHAPLLLLCLARPELLETRPTWGGGRHRVITMTLSPLSEDESRTLARRLLGVDAPDELVDAVIERSEGNPLFLEQVVARLSDEGLVSAGGWTGGSSADLDVPPTIHALLASRLDRLDDATRSMLAIAAVDGRRFSVATVAFLADRSEVDIRASLEPLEPRGFVEQEDGSSQRWRFAHALIRDAAYQRMPKERRAELHENLAARLASSGADDEAIARHLQQSIAFRREVLLDEEHTTELARAAGERFAAAGEGAYDRLDSASAATLLERAVTFLPEDAAERFRILPHLGVALMEIGRAHDAEALLADAIDVARERGAELDALRAHVQLVVARGVYRATTAVEIETQMTQLEGLRIPLRRHGHRGALAEFWVALGYLEFMRGNPAAMFKANLQAMEDAAAAGWPREEMQAASDIIEAATLGPMTFDEIRAFGNELRATDDPIRVSTGLAAILAADVAQGIDPAEAEQTWQEFTGGHGLVWLESAHSAHIAALELESGALESAERRILRARQTAAAMGDIWYTNMMEPILAFTMEAQGRTHEFLRIADRYESHMSVFDLVARVHRHRLRSRAFLRRGALDDAEASAREAFKLVESSGLVPTKAEALVELSTVLSARGFASEATSYRDAAVETYRRKGNITAIAALTRGTKMTSEEETAGAPQVVEGPRE